MPQRNQFVICNDLAQPLRLNIEPEGAVFSLSKGEEVQITDVFTSQPVTIKLTRSEKGEPVVSIWPGDGEVTVEKDGIDMLDMLPIGGNARSA
ncbi:MAG: hypothetical protein WD872_00090 [Pirellulaceae bacterium]